MKDCIDRHVKKIQKKTGYANYLLDEILNRAFDRLHYQCNLSCVLFEKCIDMELMVPKPPPVSDKDIAEEVLNAVENKKDAVAFELTRVFGDYLIQLIREKIAKDPLMTPINKIEEQEKFAHQF